MLCLGQQIRLTRAEQARFTRLTDIVPTGIHSMQELDCYIARCKAHYWGVSQQTRFLHWLIDREYRQCRQLG